MEGRERQPGRLSGRFTEAGHVGPLANRQVEHEGELYVELSKKVHLQHAVSLLVRDIIPVAEVQLHETEGGHYSQVGIEIEVGDGQPTTEEIAGGEFLNLALGDDDHFVKNVSRQESGPVFYDFDSTDLLREMNDLRFRRIHTEESLKMTLGYLEQFERVLQGEEGVKSIEAIIRESQASPQDFVSSATPQRIDVENLQDLILNRIQRGKGFLSGALMGLRSSD